MRHLLDYAECLLVKVREKRVFEFSIGNTPVSFDVEFHQHDTYHIRLSHNGIVHALDEKII